MHSTTLPWIVFGVIVFVMLALDLGVFSKQTHEVRFKEALIWSFVWVSLAMLFNVGVYFYFGPSAAMEFLSGYLIEKALSIDNLFIFILIFTTFKTPKKYQHKVLYWGILGALLMRALFIYAGITLIQKFEWVIYIFGAFLIYSGFHIYKERNADKSKSDILNNTFMKFLLALIPTKKQLYDDKLFVKENKRTYATPLFTALVFIEFSDLIFALDSIPAILAVTTNTFIVYTSNIFAILGLRSLYFLVQQSMDKFKFLTHGLAFILCFVGLKMMLSHFIKVPTLLSLAIIFMTATVSVLTSIYVKEKS